MNRVKVAKPPRAESLGLPFIAFGVGPFQKSIRTQLGIGLDMVLKDRKQAACRASEDCWMALIKKHKQSPSLYAKKRRRQPVFSLMLSISP